jgi:hypothetical protein
MKTLNFDELVLIQGGSITKVLSCASQVTGGMGTLASVAAILTFGTNPIGWAILGLSVISLAAGAASDPTACD